MPANLPPRHAPSRLPSTGANRGAVLAIAVTASILASFAAGVLVGRSQRPDPVEPDPLALENESPSETSGPTIEMTRPDGSTVEVQPAGVALEPAPVTPPAVAAEALEPAPAAPAPKPEPAPATRPKPGTQRPPAREPAANSGKAYTIQVAAFRDRESAERLSLALESKGFDAYVQKTTIPEKGIWYRVRVGAFSSKEEARKQAERLQRQEGRSAYVTVR